ncbi:hypothetical protein BDF22DRAFT_683471 [Syncephalis plumigaleata]|nr:hypothetical protein BDF22DRAFT_683471 [Syncephalis plumigaleata]
MPNYPSLLLIILLANGVLGQGSPTTFEVVLATPKVPGTEGGWPPTIPGTNQPWPPVVPGTGNGWPPNIPGVNGTWPPSVPGSTPTTASSGVSAPTESPTYNSSAHGRLHNLVELNLLLLALSLLGLLIIV